VMRATRVPSRDDSTVGPPIHVRRAWPVSTPRHAAGNRGRCNEPARRLPSRFRQPATTRRTTFPPALDGMGACSSEYCSCLDQ
jgi:hypothetical protein